MDQRADGAAHGMQLALSRGAPWDAVAMIAATVALTAFVSIPTFLAMDPSRLFSDADWYRTALPALTSDAPLYDPSKLGPHRLEHPPYWNLAPSTALFTPILLLPGGDWIWGALMAGSVILGLVLVWPRIGVPATLLLAALILAWYPTVTALTKGNLNSLIFLMLAVALRYPRAAGWAIGIAAAAKVAPVLGVAWLLGRRDWRGVAIAIVIPLVATAIVMFWKGPETLTDFLVLRMTESKPDQGGRIGVVATLGVSPTVALLLGGAVALVAWRYASFTLAVAAMLVSIPVMHSHYWTWALVPLLGIGIPLVMQRAAGSMADSA